MDGTPAHSDRVPLRMTLTDIAALAHVQRPVVSLWRTRSAGSGHPFPDPVVVDNGRPHFDADEVAAWLAATGRGNNAEADADLAAFARPQAQGQEQQTSRPRFDGLTALLTLKALTGGMLGHLDTDELLDTADDHDPDDLFLFSEIASVGGDLVSLAHFADRLADSAYTAAEAFEGLLANRFRTGPPELAATALTDAAQRLLVTSAVELSAGLDGEPGFVDAAGGGGDVLMAVVDALSERDQVRVVPSDDDGPAARLLRRRLRVHGVDTGPDPVADPIEGSSSLVHLAQYPSPGQLTMSTAEILTAIERISDRLDDHQRAVVLAPARVLSDTVTGRDAADLRSGILRAGRVRAIVRLPAGLLRSRPREVQALWVLGPSFADVPIADRWTMVADLGQRALTQDVSRDLVSDLVASMGDLATVRAHAFRFARLVRTRSLLAAPGSLVTDTGHHRDAQRSPAEDALRAEHLNRILGAAGFAVGAVPAGPDRPAGGRRVPERVPVARLLAARTLRYLPGNRWDAPSEETARGAALLGPAEVLDPTAQPRRIPVLDFVQQVPGGRLTEPGDVVFCTSPRPAAMVDTAGGSVVVFPARAFRIDAGDPGGLLAEVVAADINALGASEKEWRRWLLRTTPEQQRAPLHAALRGLRHEQDALRERLGLVEELARLILDGVAGGSLTLTGVDVPDAPTHPVSTEGTA
ncbi:hypothetical protein [Arthrobacter echini]|nr:hypothetical protein [Arthrobacter echini]